MCLFLGHQIPMLNTWTSITLLIVLLTPFSLKNISDPLSHLIYLPIILYFYICCTFFKLEHFLLFQSLAKNR